MSRTVVLIDDDKIIRQAWEKQAALKGILIIGYPSVDKFLVDEKLFQKEIDIYIDSDLEGESGIELAAKLKAANFNSITLLTSIHFDSEQLIPEYIKAVTSKNPPF